MKLIEAFVFSVINRIFKIFDWHIIFVNSSGIKCINQSMSSDYLRSLKVIEEIELNPADLYLSFDGLKDKYTLLDCSIKHSPHFDFVEKLNLQKQYHETDYFKRFIGGKLDLRYNQLAALYDFKALFKAKKELINSDQNLPVLVSEINRKYYVIDGKHSASLSLVLNKKIKCLLLDNPYNHPFYKSLYSRMKKDEPNFLKNIEFLKMALAK